MCIPIPLREVEPRFYQLERSWNCGHIDNVVGNDLEGRHIGDLGGDGEGPNAPRNGYSPGAMKRSWKRLIALLSA